MRLALLLLVAAAVRAEDPSPNDAAPAATPGEEVTSPPLPPPDAAATDAADAPQTDEEVPREEETPPPVEEKPAPIMVQDVDDEDDAPAAPKKVINYASKDAGALVVEKSGTSKGFEQRFRLVVGVIAKEVIQMQSHHGVVHQSLKKFPQQIDIKITHPGSGVIHAIVQTRTPRQIDHCPGQGFVQGHIGVAIARQSAFITNRLVQGLAKDDAHIFDHMMGIHL